MATFYQVYLKPKSGVGYAEIREKMDLALDWYKYAENCWILKSMSTPEKLYTRLKTLVEPDGELFICKLDVSQSQGWMSKKLWAWLRKSS